MARPKGGQKFGGRTKGTPNKNTAQLKDMILEALNDAGGIDYLKEQAEQNPTAFLTLVGKVLPLQLSGGDKPAGGVAFVWLPSSE